ncbi:hypothetical protein JCGZ_19045 [Jatropha curcas]|uniref:Uncharacterized protein n=1 Tax=Jatropha curcas TaxID=180498 RepID=A0A067K6R6_JATCU|nr:hypothetical protein JCGZ_19045 [Jatropha curcas]
MYPARRDFLGSKSKLLAGFTKSYSMCLPRHGHIAVPGTGTVGSNRPGTATGTGENRNRDEPEPEPENSGSVPVPANVEPEPAVP